MEPGLAKRQGLKDMLSDVEAKTMDVLEGKGKAGLVCFEEIVSNRNL